MDVAEPTLHTAPRQLTGRYAVAVLLAGAEITLRVLLSEHTDIKVAANFLYPVCVIVGLALGAGPSMLIAALGMGSLFFKNTSTAHGTLYITALLTFCFTISAFNWAIDRRTRAQRLALREARMRRAAQEQAEAADLERAAVAKLLGVHEATSRALATTLPVGVWVSHDARAERITGNDEALRTLRLDPGAEIIRGAAPGASFEIRRNGSRIPAADLPMARASRGDEVRGDDIEVHFADGGEHVLRVSAIPQLDATGKPAGAVGVVVDITERRRAEERMQESEARFRVMGDHAPVLLWMADAAKTRTWFNRPWLEFTGRTMDQERGYGWANGIHPDDKRRVVEAQESSIDRREPFRVKYRLRRHDAEYRWMFDHGVPLAKGAGSDGYVGTLVDITDMEVSRRGIESYVKDLERANRELEDFAHIAAHDLKEPLRGMRLVASFLQEDYAAQLGTEGAARIRTLQDLCERSQRLLESLMEVAQVSRAEPSLEECRVGDLASEATHLLSSRVRESGAKIAVPEASKDVRIMCDRRRTVQALMNLIGNAIKYNESAEKCIEVGVVRRDAAASTPITLYVRDNGIGIPADRHKDIFQLFRRLHSRDAYGGGTGAGLAIVKRIAERHGGNVWMESELGKGSTFYMTLSIS